ncbi:hypothetical protein [Tropicimonas sp.]|uniref:hypothetical protein n=1 Tax=Tropicimonas sp. TaxID=2067044 RepID=UPI003A8AB6FF
MILDPDFGVHASRPDGPQALYRAVLAKAVLDLFGKAIPASEGDDDMLPVRCAAKDKTFVRLYAVIERGDFVDCDFAGRAIPMRGPINWRHFTAVWQFLFDLRAIGPEGFSNTGATCSIYARNPHLL